MFDPHVSLFYSHIQSISLPISGCIPMILQPFPTCSVAAKMCGTPNLGMMGNSSMFNGIIIGKLFPVGKIEDIMRNSQIGNLIGFENIMWMKK